MTSLAVLVVLAAALFAMVFFTRRRFGVLGLGLAAGFVLSDLWVNDLTPLVAESGIVIIRPPLESIVAAVLVLLPAVGLLLSGPSYKSVLHRGVGAAMFALLAITFLLNPLQSALIIESPGKVAYDFLYDYRSVIVTGGLIFAIFDVMATRTAKREPKSRH